MVINSKLALTALHEALVAARNIAGEGRDIFQIIEELEAVPLLLADDKDRTEDLVRIFDDVAERFVELRPAAATAHRLRA